MIASPNHSGRSGKRVRLVVLHTAEGARTTKALGDFFAKPSASASSHVGIDNQGIEQYVPYDRAAWTLRSGNPISDNAELCGFAKWTREQWLNENRPMLENAARWVRERCQARGIPMRKLSPSQVAAGESGVIGHDDWTKGMRDGSHWDPGPEFPWDVLMELVEKGVITMSWDQQLKDDQGKSQSAGTWLWQAAQDSAKVRGYFEEQLQSQVTDPATGERSTYTTTPVGYILNIDGNLYSLLQEWQKEREAAAAHRAHVEERLNAIMGLLGEAAP